MLGESSVAFVSIVGISELVFMLLGITGVWSQTAQWLQGLGTAVLHWQSEPGQPFLH